MDVINHRDVYKMSAKNTIDIFHTETCIGCLSIDRRLTQIDDESKRFFTQIFDDNLAQRLEPLCLCWECLAHTKNALKFKKRVYSATALLKNISKEHVSAKHTLSSLKIIDATRYNIGLTEEISIEPLATVKIEYDDNSFDDTEELYASNVLYDHIGDAPISNSENETKPEELIEEKTEKPKKRLTRNHKTKPIDSDDEPLKPKHGGSDSDDNYVPEKNRKQRKKRRNKETKYKDGKTLIGPKKEKPGGVVNNKRVKKKLEELNVDSSKVEMVILTWEEVEEERQKALNSVTFTRHDYRCYDCVLGFNHKFKLENHMKKHDKTAGSSECNVCHIRCRDGHALSAHKRRHRVRWRCVSCGAMCSRAAVAADHAARAHDAARPTHACVTCGHTASTLGKLRIHLKNHMERQKCELCGKTFRDRTSLRTHLFIHKGEKEYSCTKCDKKFLFKKAMEVHMVTHEAPAGLYCHECDMNFKNQMSYYQHMKYNLKHIDPAKLKFACQLCDKRFVKASRLEEHHVAVHLKATPVRCTMPGCEFACSSRPVLRTHIRMLHRNLRAVRNHVCDTCGKAYTTKKTLEGHMRTHTGERPFHCQLCPSTFGYEAALYNHNKLVHLKAKTGRRNQNPGLPAPSAELTRWENDNA